MTKQFVRFLAWGCLFGSSVALADQIDFGEWGWFFDLAVHFTPHLVLAGIVISTSLFFVKAPKLLIAVLCMTGVHIYSVFGHTNFVRPSPTLGKSSNTITVMTANIWRSANALTQLADLAEIEKVDIIAISEMTADTCKDLSMDFPQYSFCQIADRNSDWATLSKRMALLSKNEPLSFSIVAKPEFRNRAIIDAVFEYGSRKMQIIVVHPVAPGSPAHMRDRNHVLLAIEPLLQNQIDFIVMGDMNTTPWSRISRQLPGVRAGDPKFESTWLSRLPLIGLPIDHIRLSDSLELIEYRVGRNIGSDHRPLIATLYLRDDTE